MRQKLSSGHSVRGVRTLDVLPPVSAVEVAGGAAGDAAHLPHVQGVGEGGLR